MRAEPLGFLDPAPKLPLPSATWWAL